MSESGSLLFVRSKSLFVLVLIVVGYNCSDTSAWQASTPVPTAGLGRGVNFANMLEAPYEGAWGLFAEERYFDHAKAAGFDHVRLPVSWAYHADATAPYTIDSLFIERVDWCIEQLLQRELKIIVNFQYYGEFNQQPAVEKARFLGIWRQIAERYANQPNQLLFEPFNEPHGVFNEDPQLWNDIIPEYLTVIRETNPNRKVIVGPTHWNSAAKLPSLELPEDPNLIVTIHHYDPFDFTHQGAFWLSPVLPTGRTFFPSKFVFQPGWQDWSWETETRSTATGIWLDYDEFYSGFRVHKDDGFENASRLVFSADTELMLSVTFINENGDEGTIPLLTEDRFRNYVIDIPSLGVTGKLTDVVIQNNGTPPGTRWRCRNMILFSDNGQIEYIIQTEKRAIQYQLETAAKWAVENNVPLYLGEFGSYELADMPSRVRWSKQVRVACENRNIDWGYWGLAGSFGIFDPILEEFHFELTRSMIPGFGP